MKRTLVILLTLVTGGLIQIAAASAHDWEGPYVGLNLGAAIERSHTTTTTVFSATGYFAATSPPAIAIAGSQKLSKTGFTGGGQIGYNWQTGPDWVVGVEADFDSNSNSSLRTATGIYPCCAPTTFTVSSKVVTNWLFTARPRIGYLTDDWMTYITGGLAMTNEKAGFLFTDTFATANESAVFTGTRTGWTIGGGFENGLAPNWSLKLEYLYADFGGIGGTSTNLTAFSPAIAFPTSVFTHHASLTEHIIRVGINYELQ